jgi:hypothetical protein
MKKFLTLIIFFSAPLLITFLLPFLILYHSKENFVDIDNFILNNSNKEYLVGYLYNEKNYSYLKFQSICERDKVDVLALGSSRVLQFREEMFIKPFFNAGYTIGRVSDFSVFLSKIPDSKLPKYLLLGLDQWMFNKTWNKINKPKLTLDWSRNSSMSIESGFNATIKFYKDIVKGKIDLTHLFQERPNDNSELIGLNAILNHTGFRNDGSMYYGKQIERLLKSDSVNYDFIYKESFDRIKKGNNRFEYGEEIDSKAISDLDSFLSYCNAKGIKVIGIIQPYSDKVFTEMIISKNYKYIDKLSSHINPVFNKYNYEIYSYNSTKKCDSSDTEMIDGFHGGEVVYLRMILDILSQNSELNSVCDLKRLNDDLLKRKNRYLLYKGF